VVEPLSETPSQLETRTFIAVRRFLRADSLAQPLVLMLDNVERASAETVNLLHYLAAGLHDCPVCIITIGRPSVFDVHPSFGEGDVALQRIEVGPLTPDEARAFLTELVRPAGAVPSELQHHVESKLGGGPRALVELIRYLREVEIIHLADGRWTLSPERMREFPLPASLEEVVAERLRVMEASERDLLEKAASSGEVFWLDLLAALVRATALERGDPDGPTLGEIAAAGDRTRHEVQATLARLVERGFLVELSHSVIAGERQYAFAYPPWWEVVYEGIETAARQRYHRLIAQWLELRPSGRNEETQEEIGRHLELAGDGDGASVHYRRAGDAARLGYFNDRAIRLYVAALGCLQSGDIASRIHLWHDLGGVFQLKGDFDSALGAFERMLRLAWVVASRTKAAVAFNKMGRIYRQKGDLPIALEYFERGLELFEQADDVRGVAGSLDDIGQVLWLLGRYDEALARSNKALETRRELADRRSIAASLYNIGNIERHRGHFKEAEVCYREALEMRTAEEDRAGVVQAMNGLGVLAFQRGDIDAAKKEWQTSLKLAEQIGAQPLQAQLLLHLGEAAIEEGQRAEAFSHFSGAEALARDLDDRRLLSDSLRHLGLLSLMQGDRKGAETRCNHALALADRAGIRVAVGRALVSLGEVAAATLFEAEPKGAAPVRAEDYFQRGVDLFREIGNDAELALSLERYGRYLIERGSLPEGKRLLTEAQEIGSRLGMRKGENLRRILGEL
jgi:tetratricopeptide (TPR) repeat protein